MTASHRVGRQSWYWWMLSELADGLKFSLNTPWEKLPAKVQQAVLYGVPQGSSNEAGSHDSFEGVIPNLMRRWKETDSDWTRVEVEKYMVIKVCPDCRGKRLRPESLAVKVADQSIDVVTAMSIAAIAEFFTSLLRKKGGLTKSEFVIAKPIMKEALNRLGFLREVGLEYLTLDRSSTTLAGGEGQRIRLATQIGTRLTGVLYILDEPSVGLHPRDQARLIATLKELRDLGNTMVVVEHDPQTIFAADWVIDVGPGAGKHGGRITFTGTPKELVRSHTLTGEDLSGRRKIRFPSQNHIEHSAEFRRTFRTDPRDDNQKP